MTARRMHFAFTIQAHTPIEVNGELTEEIELGGGMPQGLGPSSMWYAIGSEGLKGLMAHAGIQGTTVQIPSTRSITCTTMQ